MDLKPGDVVLLKVLACVLILFFSFRFLILPGFETHQDLVQTRDERQAKKDEMEQTIQNRPVIEKKIVKQTQALKESSEGFYGLLENQEVDELVTGIALKHSLKPVALKIENTTPVLPAAYQAVQSADGSTSALESADQALAEADGTTEEEGKSDASVLKYVNTTLVSMTLQGTEAQIREMLDDITKNYPGVQMCSFQMTENTYVDDSLQQVTQNNCQCVIAVYTCGQLGK